MTSTPVVEVVASGTVARVERWGELLHELEIEFEIRRVCEEKGPVRSRHAELWVDRDNVDRARSIMCRDTKSDASLLW